ncbi:unnamed protein product, partial [Ectocarpus sp. 12 AP-2014]
MNGIMGSAELLKGQDLSPVCTEYVRTISSCGTSLLTIVDDVLDMSKIQANMMNMKEVSMRTNCVFHDAVYATWAGYARSPHFKRSVSLTLEISSASVVSKVRGDPTRMRQVVCNLVSNALKFTDKGTVKVTVDVENGPSEGTVYIKSTVADTGIGMSVHTMKKLFQPFSQVHRERDVGGTGLGLVITQKLVNLMGGEISCESKAGVGTKFSFSLLACLDTSTSNDSLGTTTFDIDVAYDSANQPRILVVDDNGVNRLVASKLLESFGCAVELADNGLQAIEACDVSVFSLIIMDKVMPVMDGVEAAREIRAGTGLNKDTKLMFLTATVSSEAIIECNEAGGNDFMTKPLSRHILYDKVTDNL